MALAVLLCSSHALAEPPPRLEELRPLFEHPPDDSRILMRWWWFGPSVTRPQLEREMRLMKEAGIGGFEVQPVYPVALDDPASGVRILPFLSDDFLEALRFVWKESRELSLRMDLTLGSGWPFGGPHVPITGAAGKLRVERSKVAAGARRVTLPDVGAGEKLLAVFLAGPHGESNPTGNISELDDVREGAAYLPAGLEGGEALFFIAGRTGMMVKRPAVGAEGFVLDHYDRNAVDAYLSTVGDRLLQAFDTKAPYAVFCDSLEVFVSDWTGDFLEEFRRRRGYDLRPHLPALVVEMGPKTSAIRHDWGRTLAELFDERFMAPMREWAERHGTRFRIQGYGVPPATLASNALAHLSEGEGQQWKVVRASRWASSANHVFGRPVTSSETWTWLHSPSFRATPLDLKAEADLHFLQGVNQLIGHGWPYTAEGAAYPGWRFYAAGAFNEKNPWWIVMPDLALYLQRLSFLLRQGEPANDVALYLPNADAFGGFVPGRVPYLIEALRDRVGPQTVAKILEAGLNLDFFDDGILQRLGRAEKGALVLGPGRYKAVVLPNVETIPLESLRRLEEFVRAGGVLIATRRLPERAPGFLAPEFEHTEVRETVRRLFSAPRSPAHYVEDEEGRLAATLARLVTPDVRLGPAAQDVGFVHRRAPSADIYFLANTANGARRATATFRVAAQRAEWWDPHTGRASPAEPRPDPNGGMSVALDLEPYGSRVLVFSSHQGGAASHPPGPTPLRQSESGSAASFFHRGGAASHPPTPPPRLRQSESGSAASFSGPASLDLSAGWRVSFGAGPPRAVERLSSWTDDEDTRFFSGVATYQRTVTVPEDLIHDGLGLRLDFGEGRAVEPVPNARFQAWLDGPVREAAVVFVNGRRAGSVWHPPYALDLTGLLHSGVNELRVEVGNLAINHMAGHALPDYRLLNLRYGVRFEPQDMDDLKPLPAGLLGPVHLVAEAQTGKTAMRP